MTRPSDISPPGHDRADRGPGAIRSLAIRAPALVHPEGSAEITIGRTRVLCTASVETAVPQFALEAGHGWVTAEYAMLPRATNTRGRRGPSGRSKEISRLVGRTLRQAVDLKALAGHVITVDCDVLQADGGTRTAAITGGWVALAQAVGALVGAGRVPPGALGDPVAAVSVGVVDGVALLDLDYEEDSRAEVDLNVAMTAGGDLVEIQGTAERAPFSRQSLEQMLDLASRVIESLVAAQRQCLAEASPCGARGSASSGGAGAGDEPG